MKNKGLILWLTGLSGSGKTTIAKGVEHELRKYNCQVDLLDGDVVRNNLSKDLGFSKEDRDNNIRRIGFVANLLSRNNVVAIVSAISPYRATRDEVRKMTEKFIEVYVNAPLEVCEERDVKGLYAMARTGKIKYFTGIDDPYEEPLNPDIVCYTAVESVEKSIAKVIDKLKQIGVLQKETVMDKDNVNKPPVFILSCPRSGSTLLQYIIDTHPEIATLNQLYLGRLCQNLYEVVFRTIGEVSPVSDETEKKLIVLAEVKRIISDLMNSYTTAKNKQMWCDKTPYNLKSIDSLNEVFPEAKYICLYRNCMDIVHSSIECSKFGFMHELADYVRQSPSNIVGAMINSWIDNTKKLLTFERQNTSKCFRVKYESLVLEPSRYLKPLFNFLGVEWNENLLDAVFSVQHDQDYGDPKIRYSNSIYKSSLGKGSTIRTDNIPKPLLEEMNALLIELDYPVVNSDWGFLRSPYSTDKPIVNQSNIVLNVKHFFAHYLPEKLSKLTNTLKVSSVIYKFMITGEGGGVWMLDLNKPSNQIFTGDGNADCIFTISSKDFLDIVNGNLNAAEAFMQDKLHVSGDFKLAEIAGQVLFKS